MDYVTVSSLEELDALPLGSVIGIERYEGSLRVWHKEDDNGSEDDWYSKDYTLFDSDWLPAILLWKPESKS